MSTVQFIASSTRVFRLPQSCTFPVPWHQRVLRMLLLMPLVSVALASNLCEPPYDPMALTAISKTLVLIEITKVTRNDPVVKDGVEVRKFSFSAKVIEVVRGKWTEKEYQYAGATFRILDEEAARKSVRDVQAMETLLYRSKLLCGAEDCEVGERYLAVRAKLGEHFAFIAKDDKTWRKQIRKEIDGL